MENLSLSVKNNSLRLAQYGCLQIVSYQVCWHLQGVWRITFDDLALKATNIGNHEEKVAHQNHSIEGPMTTNSQSYNKNEQKTYSNINYWHHANTSTENTLMLRKAWFAGSMTTKAWYVYPSYGEYKLPGYTSIN